MYPKEDILCDVFVCEETFQVLLADQLKYKIIATFKY